MTKQRIGFVSGWGRIDPVDERRLYADAFDEIRRAMPEIPHITYYVSLVIHKVESLEEIYWDATSSEDEHDLTDLTELLNKS